MLINGILRFTGIVLGFVLTLVIISELDKESAGIYFAAYANVMFLATIMRLGMDETLLKYSSLYNSNEQSKIVAHRVLYKCFFLVLLFYLFFLTVFFFTQDIISSIFDREIFLTIKRLLVLPVFLLVINFLCVFFQGIGYVKISVIGLTVINIFVSIILIYSLDISSPKGLADVVTLATGIAALFCMFFYFNIFGFVKTKQSDSKVSFAELSHSFLPLWIVVVSGQVFQWSAQIVGSQYLSPSDLADVALSVRFSQLALMILVVVNYLYGPVFRNLYKQGDIKKILSLYKHIVFFSSLTMIVLSGLLFLIFPVVTSLLGSDYSSFQTLFYVFWAGQCVNVAIGPIGYVYTMCNQERQLMFFSVVCSSITVFSLYVVAYGKNSLWLAIVASVCIAFYKFILLLNFRLMLFPKLLRS